MKDKRLYDSVPELSSEPSFDYKDFAEVESTFLKVYYGILHAGMIQGR